ncbi:hypothetical protein LguiA_022674 [Lonicera macranthoides]
MNLYGGYGTDLSLYDFGFSDPSIFEFSRNSPILSHPSSTSITAYYDDDDKPSRPAPKKKNSSPPKHRHDGTSPLPLGMDWSPPPRNWEGRDSVWPHDPHTGWSYCATIPSWIILPNSRGSDHAVFYRVQVGIQSPEGITTTRGILRRFSDFLKLFSDLTKAFPKKKVPPAPPRRLLRMRNRTLLEERRCALEDWMEKILSDIHLSRSADVANFLELEAAARSSFHDSYQTVSDANSSVSNVVVGSSSIASEHGTDSAYETSEIRTPKHGMENYAELGLDNITDHDLVGPTESTVRDGLSGNDDSRFIKDFIQGNQVKFSRHKIHSGRVESAIGTDKVNESTSGLENYKLGSNHIRRLSTESDGSDLSSVRASEISNYGDNSLELGEGAEASRSMDSLALLGLQFPSDLLVALPSEERNKMNRVLITMQRRLATAKTDMEDLIARLNQELAVRQYLTTKVKDLEVELETTKQSGKDNLQQAILIERERFTQMQWDMEELRRKCSEMELKVKSEQDEKLRIESTKVSIVKENEMLLQELDTAREQLENMHKLHEDSELKSKSDIKLLVKEVKSLRNVQLELKQELSRLMKEKLEVERVLLKEKQRWEHENAVNAKLLHECEILRNRLEECSVNFLVEEEDKLIMDTPSPSDAIDLLTTSDNRIGLLLAEAQLLAQDVENGIIAAMSSNSNNNGSVNGRRTRDDELRKMLTEMFIDNARVRKQVNSAIRCALSTTDKSDKDDNFDDDYVKEESSSRKTVLSKFLER